MPQKLAEYPPRVFKSRLSDLLKQAELDVYWLARFLQVTPVTAQRVKNGCDLKLSYALKLAKHFHVPIEQIWSTP